MIETIINAIKNSDKNLVLIDGFPRSREQMIALDTILKTSNEIELNSVIEVKVSEDVAKERILGRASQAEVKRDDDNEEVFYKRMKIYTEPLSDIENFYREKGLLKIIDGERDIESIVTEMESFIKKLQLNLEYMSLNLHLSK